MRKVIIDCFCGWGGASVGEEMALGRYVNYAINHNPDAIKGHQTNHPFTVHLTEDIFTVNLRKHLTYGDIVVLMWASPDCTSHSKAKGGAPRESGLRILPWAIYGLCLQIVDITGNLPEVIPMENVEEIQKWGPLDENNKPIKELSGVCYQCFVGHMSNGEFQTDGRPINCSELCSGHCDTCIVTENKYNKVLGYQFDSRELIAADYGAPTTRKRWYAIFRNDGKSIVWPEPTHSKSGKNGLEKWVPVSTVLDFSDLGKSIFGRKKPLADNTMNRIARGIEKFVFNNPEPFIMQIGQTGFSKDRNRSIHEPLSTIVTKNEHCIVTPLLTPYMVTVNHSGAKHHYCNSLEEPLKTITQKHGFGIVTPTLMQYHSYDDRARGQELNDPIRTIDTNPRYALVSTFLSKFYKSGIGQEVTEPLHTITTSPGHFAKVSVLTFEKEDFFESLDLPIKDQNIRNDFIQKCNWVASFILEYYGQGTGQSLKEPLHTVVTKDRFALVTICGIDYVIIDILLRMLTPEELKLAQGFPKDYIINRDYTGKKVSISKQVKGIGNSVVPIMAEKIITANCGYLKVGERMPNMRIDDSQAQFRFA